MFLILRFRLWSTTGMHPGEYGYLDPCLDLKTCSYALAFIVPFFSKRVSVV